MLLKKEILENSRIIKAENKELKEKIEKLNDIIDRSIKCVEKDIRWFDAEYASTYGELCNCAGANDTRLEIMLNPTNVLNILKEAIKNE